MDTEYLIVDQSCQSQVVKDLSAIAPHIDRAVLAQALIVEAIDLGDLSRLMISSNQGNSLRVSDLHSSLILLTY